LPDQSVSQSVNRSINEFINIKAAQYDTVEQNKKGKQKMLNGHKAAMVCTNRCPNTKKNTHTVTYAFVIITLLFRVRDVTGCSVAAALL